MLLRNNFNVYYIYTVYTIYSIERTFDLYCIYNIQYRYVYVYIPFEKKHNNTILTVIVHVKTVNPFYCSIVTWDRTSQVRTQQYNGIVKVPAHLSMNNKHQHGVGVSHPSVLVGRCRKNTRRLLLDNQGSAGLWPKFYGWPLVFVGVGGSGRAHVRWSKVLWLAIYLHHVESLLHVSQTVTHNAVGRRSTITHTMGWFFIFPFF